MALASRVLVLVVLAAIAGCRAPSRDATVVIDLIDLFPKAEKRAAAPAEQAFQVSEVDFGGDARRSIRAAAPSRIIWALSIPLDARLRVALGLPVAQEPERRTPAAVRIGISDNRVYEILFQRSVEEVPEAVGRWAPVELDLRRYAGWQWSLFYRPSSRTWRIVFSLDARAGEEGASGYWGTPRIEGRR